MKASTIPTTQYMICNQCCDGLGPLALLILVFLLLVTTWLPFPLTVTLVLRDLSVVIHVWLNYLSKCLFLFSCQITGFPVGIGFYLYMSGCVFSSFLLFPSDIIPLVLVSTLSEINTYSLFKDKKS